MPLVVQDNGKTTAVEESSTPVRDLYCILNKDAKLSCLAESECYGVFYDNGCVGLGYCFND